MKKPVALNREQLEALVAKRKNILTTETKRLTAKTLDDVIAQVKDFAREQGVEVSEVRLANESWSGAVLKVRRTETDEEKFKRIQHAENQKFQHKKWEYDNWKREQEREAAIAARHLDTAMKNKTIVVKCDCKCKCP